MQLATGQNSSMVIVRLLGVQAGSGLDFLDLQVDADCRGLQSPGDSVSSDLTQVVSIAYEGYQIKAYTFVYKTTGVASTWPYRFTFN